MALQWLHSQALLLPNSDTSFVVNAQLHSLYRVTPSKSKWLCRRLVVASATPRREEPRKEINLDQHDLMTLEFGRLLGEPEEKTLSKVLRRKIDPGSSYVANESKAKGGKGLMNNADFVVKVERPTTAPGNSSHFSTDLPRLTSPPTRQRGSSSINFPKLGSKRSPCVDTEEVALDDFLLRKPSSSQVMRVGLPPSSAISPGVDSSTSKSVFEDDSNDLEGLCRPSIAKGQETGKTFLHSSDQVKNSKFSLQKPRQDVSHVLVDDSESMEASKLEFQQLLDKSFDLPVTQKHPSRESLQATQEDYILKLAVPKRPLLRSHSSQVNGVQQLVDMQDDKSPPLGVHKEPQQKPSLASALPHLASRPARQKGSLGTFVLPVKARNTATPSSIKRPTVDVSDELLLRKPENQASDNVNLSSMQLSEGFHALGHEEAQKSSKARVQHNLDKPFAVPHLATPPSRHSGSFDTFIGPGRQKEIRSPSKDCLDDDADEYLLRKPSILEKTVEGLGHSSWTEANTAPLSISAPKKLEDKLDDTILLAPSMEADTTQVCVQLSHQPDGLKQVVGAHPVGGEASQLNLPVDLPGVSHDIVAVSKAVTPVQSQEELSGMDGANQVNDSVSNVPLSVGLQDVHNSSKVKRVEVAPLKNPVKASLSDPMVYASKSKSAQKESAAQVSDMCPDILLRMPQWNGIRENPSLAIGSEFKTLQSECNAEESLGSQSPVEAISAAEQVSDDDQERDRGTHKQPSEEKHQALELLLDTGLAFEEPTIDLLQPSDKALRRPTQFTPANSSAQQSDQVDFPASNTKLHLAKEEEAKEWARAEGMLKSKEQVEVKLIGSNSAGLFVSFGCLVGFLPSFELSPKRGLLDFPSWAQKNGIDLSLKNAPLKRNAINGSQSSAVQDAEMSNPAATLGGDVNELKNKYKEEITKLMSSFVGEKTKVIVKLIDKTGRKLKLSEKEADPGYCEHVQKKANLMAELKLGDVVTCAVKSITPIGVFVEVDGVPALIHHSEVSWNKRVEPASLLNIGQVIKAKVCRLDRALQRINLSLKQMQTDPLKRTLESVVGESESDSAICVLDTIESTDVFWPELEGLTKKLEKMEGVASISMGRCLNSAAFAPTFQVLISTPQSNGYKLLARYGNKIHEILVDTTLDRDKMKDCIRLCTFAGN